MCAQGRERELGIYHNLTEFTNIDLTHTWESQNVDGKNKGHTLCHLSTTIVNLFSSQCEVMKGIMGVSDIKQVTLISIS